MKYIAFLFIVGATLFSCSKNSDETTEFNYQGTWTLTKMSGGLIFYETTGDDMDWQEFYVLNDDETFLKSRTQDGVTIEASGTYSVLETPSDGAYIVLSYPETNTIIASCTYSTKEELYIDTNKLLGTWNYCDGPGLEYERLR